MLVTESMRPDVESSDIPAGLLRRLGAIISDSVVVIGLLILTTLLVAVPVLSVLNKKAMVPSEVGWILTLLYWLMMLSVWGGYFVFFWSQSGQTVGMRAWRLRVVNLAGRALGPGQAMKRLLLATAPWIPAYIIFALASALQISSLKWAGYFALCLGIWCFCSLLKRSSNQSWHDLIAEQKVILLSKL